MDPRRKALCAVYGVISVAALVATWSQNLAFMATPANGGALGFLRGTMANPAAASFGLDLGFVLLALIVWMVVEARRLRVRFVWVYVALSFLVAISVMFPLFLIARERRLAAAGAPPS
jgi:hypothetical protein